MSDITETPLICAAAGDPCIAEITKPSCPDATAKNENPEITSITETAGVVTSKTTPSDDKEILPATTVLKESGGVIEPALNPDAPIVIPEVLASTNGNDAQDSRLTNLQEEYEKRTSERDNYERKLADTEKKLAALELAYEQQQQAVTSGDAGSETNLRRELKELRGNLAQSQAKLNDRGRLMANQENQINALTKQVSSLKEVVAITKNLLEIRNMEVKHLQDDVDSMENRITAERDRHNAMLRKMEAAVRLNADLKTEYETQLRLFQDLRGKYEEKVTLLTAENKAACGAAVTEQPAVSTASIQ